MKPTSVLVIPDQMLKDINSSAETETLNDYMLEFDLTPGLSGPVCQYLIHMSAPPQQSVTVMQPFIDSTPIYSSDCGTEITVSQYINSWNR